MRRIKRFFVTAWTAVKPWLDSQFGGGHIFLIQNGEIIYDGPRNKAPPEVVDKWNALNREIKQHVKEMKDTIQQARERARTRKRT